MDKNNKESIINGEVSLGIEFGSTRIKAVLISHTNDVLAQGNFDWENQLLDGLWTYSLESIKQGLQESYLQLKQSVADRYGVQLTNIGQIGISAMMHGYLAFDTSDELMVPFRTWRNTNTAQAAQLLTDAFAFNIPLRWSISHLYQAILNQEKHVKDIARITTLSGYVHGLLTGEDVLGIGDASGMFPIDSETGQYDAAMLYSFNNLLADYDFSWKVEDLLPKVLPAGEVAGNLTVDGAKLLDPSGDLEAGSVFCPPEGDAGTGMVATNSIRPKTGNISAGTSIFSMVVLEKPLKNVYPEIDIVTTPVGDSVAMVHANNCSTELNAWVNLFDELTQLMGGTVTKGKLYELLFNQMLTDQLSEQPMLSYPYHSGEDVVRVEEGRPLFVRRAESPFNLSNFMKTQLYGAFAAVSIGMRLLTEKEQVSLDSILGHGGLFKTEGVAQRLLAGAINTPVEVMTTASEGGAWGIAVLANFIRLSSKKTLQEFLDEDVFESVDQKRVEPQEGDVKEFETFLKVYQQGISIEREAGRVI
ncbi:xylulokinase [Streptococcus hyovaginalis]